MKMRSSLLCATTAVCLLALLGSAHAKDEKAKPDATLHLTSKAVAVGVGFSWGHGELKYKGHTYEVEVDGLTVGSVGATSINAKGEVYHLTKIEDFDGTYTAVVGGGTLGGGGGGLAMKNQNGVEIEMVATSQGVSLTAGVSGVKLNVKK